jgi:AcrR family transcriptional regulator
VVPSVASHHFGSRSGLVAAVVDAFFDRLHAEVLDADLRATAAGSSASTSACAAACAST